MLVNDPDRQQNDAETLGYSNTSWICMYPVEDSGGNARTLSPPPLLFAESVNVIGMLLRRRCLSSERCATWSRWLLPLSIIVAKRSGNSEWPKPPRHLQTEAGARAFVLEFEKHG